MAPGHPTIGDALGNVPDGGVVAVAAGTYAETLELHDRRLTIRAHEGGEVILDGTGGDWPVLRVRGGSLTLQGMTLNSGAGAVVAEDVELTVERCTLSAEVGPALAIMGLPAVHRQPVRGLGADPELRNCAVTDCGSAASTSTQYARPVIESCEVSRTAHDGARRHRGRAAEPAQGPRLATVGRVRVLVVEDDENLRVAIASALRGTGFAVDAVGDLPYADEALAVNSYGANCGTRR